MWWYWFWIGFCGILYVIGLIVDIKRDKWGVEMKKQPSSQELYAELNKYERLMKKYNIQNIEELEKILKIFFLKDKGE